MSLRKNISNDASLPAPKIFIPYPQNLDPKEFLPRPNSRKPCNGFMIYRKVYQKQLNANAYNKFKMTTISRWASDLWLKENKKLKDAYREFASKIARLYSEKHRTELETLEDRLNAVVLLTAPYYIARSQQFTSPLSNIPSISDSIPLVSSQHYYVNQSFPSVSENLYLENQQFCQAFPNQFHGNQQSADTSNFVIDNDYFNNETFQIPPSSSLEEQLTTSEFDQSFFDNSF